MLLFVSSSRLSFSLDFIDFSWIFNSKKSNSWACVCHTHRESTTGSSSDEALSMCGLTAGRAMAPEAEQGFRVLVWVWLPSSSLAKGALALRCWLDVWEQGWVFSWEVDWTVFPQMLCTLIGERPAAETLELSEVQSVSAGLGLHSTMLSGVTGVPTLGQRWGWAANEGLLKWDGDVKPEVRSDCRWLAAGSKVNTWSTERESMPERLSRGLTSSLMLSCDVPAVTKGWTWQSLPSLNVCSLLFACSDRFL